MLGSRVTLPPFHLKCCQSLQTRSAKTFVLCSLGDLFGSFGARCKQDSAQKNPVGYNAMASSSGTEKQMRFELQPKCVDAHILL